MGFGSRRARRGLRRAFATAALLVLTGCGSARATEILLGNGMRVVVEARASTETSAIRLLIGGGDLEEPAGRPGLSDLHAAMLLRGTREKTGFVLARAAEELGGRLSAVSRPAAESISIEVPSENVEVALRLVAEVLLSPRLDPADLAKEKSLQIGSLATARDQPETLLQDEIYRALFPHHPLARLASPTEEQVRAITIEDVRALHVARLHPDRLALIVVGRCSPERVDALAAQLFGGIPRAPSKSAHSFGPVLPPAAVLGSDISRRVRKRTTQPMLAVALPTAGITDREWPAFALLQHVLTGFDERLYGEIREKRGYAYWIRPEGYELPAAGAFAVSTGAQEKYFGEIERIIRTELARIASEPVRAEELQRAVRYVRTEEARRDETNTGRVGVIANALAEGAPVRKYDERVARLAAVTAEEVRDLAKRLFAGKHMAMVTLY